MISSGHGPAESNQEACIRHAVKFTEKAAIEAELDELSEEDVVESITNANAVRSKKSTSRHRHVADEMIYIIEGFTFDDVLVYYKGVIRKEDQREIFYVLVSAKRSVRGARK